MTLSPDSIRFFDSDHFPTAGNGDPLTRGYLDLLFRQPSQELISNVETEIKAVECAGHLFPITVNDGQYGNSYVCSPFTHYVSYAAEELGKLGRPGIELPLRALLSVLGNFLRRTDLNRVVHVNNWMLSTNLYPDWTGGNLKALTKELVGRHPAHALVFRSLNLRQNPELMATLQKCGYLLLASRVVWQYDGHSPAFVRTSNYRCDVKLLNRSGLRIVPHEEIRPEDVPSILRLYNLLYIDKYSGLNPKFTEAYLAGCLERRLIRFSGLCDSCGVWRGVIGCFERDGVITAPIVGYDTALPLKIGLYRMLMALVLQETAQRGLLLNLSSGAGSFKRLRGGVARREFSAVYIAHLPEWRRGPWRLLTGLSNYLAMPLVQSLGL